MSTINDLPPTPTVPGFGEAFNYNVWNANTQIELCNVPWNSDYRDIVDFNNQAALDAYLNGVSGPKVRISKLTLARAGDPVRINLPFNIVYKYNYLRVYNGTQPISSRYFDEDGIPYTQIDESKMLFYFIQDVRYLAPNTTELIIMLDVWQTFGRDVQFGNCYIDRGHIAIANENQMDNNGRDYLTVPEGLDIGAEYNINKTWKYELPNDNSDVEINCWIVMGIGADIQSDPGTVEAPNLKLSSGLSVDGLPIAFDTIIFKSISDFRTFLSVFSDTPWILQSIMFITAVPKFDDDGFTSTLIPLTYNGPGSTTISDKAYRINTGSTIMIERTVAENFRNIAKGFIPTRYRSLNKFLVFPYMVVELTTYNGVPLILKPELIPQDDIITDIFQHIAPPTPRWGIVPKHYNATGTEGNYDDGEYLDFATYITNFPQFSVLNSGYLSYLAANKNSIAYGYSSADWSQQKALQGAQTSFDTEVRGQDANTQNAAVQRALNSQLVYNQNTVEISRIASGGIQGLSHLNPVAALANEVNAGVNATVNTMKNNADLNARNNANQQSVSNTIGAQNENSYQNRAYAQYAARGDYQNAINAVQARVQDAKLIQPTVVGQLGGESFIASLFSPTSISIGGGSRGIGWSIYTKIKQVNPGMYAVIGEYWLRYGYAVNRFHNLSGGLRCMNKFTYWKLKETYLISSLCPESFKQTIRGIFEKGVTVWTNPDDIGTIDLATNTPLEGISL